MKKITILHFLTILTGALSLGASSADASYYRFWRGMMRSDLTIEAFITGLNQRLLPATGALTYTEARLRSYQPVMPSLHLMGRLNLPTEVALVEYETIEGYQSFRSTDAGRAYGDLHWEFFNKDRSKSAVPEVYTGRAEFGKSYDLVGGQGRWRLGGGYFRVFARSHGFDERDYLESIRSHINHVMSTRPIGFILLVDETYVMEYVQWKSPSGHEQVNRTIIDSRHSRSHIILDDLAEVTGQMLMDQQTVPSTSIGFGRSLLFPLH